MSQSGHRRGSTSWQSLRPAAWLVLAQGLLLGAAPPEIVRVRVPADKVGAWFPPGTELRGMAVDQFEELVHAARDGLSRQSRAARPLLLRAKHRARWDAGVLAGHSELVVEPSGSGPSELVLSPWSPAIDLAEGGAPLLRVHDTGRTAIAIDSSGPTTIELNWQLRARARSNGRAFTLDLPANDTTSLTLELPTGWVPDGPDGIRQGPNPSTQPERKTWQFDGRGGKIDLRLRDPQGPGDPFQGSEIWAGGPTRIDVHEASADWKADWVVEAGPRGPRRLTLELDPRLELIDVTGAGVAEFRAESVASGTRVAIQLAGEVAGPKPITIRAAAPSPAEGAWAVPAARPIDAIWTGGTTTIHLDAGCVLQDCRELAGRRVIPPSVAKEESRLLVFEAAAPRSVAELVFRRPAADVSVEVRGQLILGNSAPRLECQLRWLVQRGRLLDLDVVLPAGWVPSHVEVAGIDEPVVWHSEVQIGGEVRVYVTPPAGDPARGTLDLNLAATATTAMGTGPLPLPRVRPAGARVADERWIAWTASGVTLRPLSAKGLAWIDPQQVLASPIASQAAPSGLHEALAWRWVLDDAEARVDRERTDFDPGGVITSTATIDRERWRLDGRIVVDAGEGSLRSIPLSASEAINGLDEPRFIDEASGLELGHRPIDASRRAAFGLAETGLAWELELPHPRRGRVALRARLQGPWHGGGRIPLIALPDQYHGRGSILVLVDRSMNSQVEVSGLRTLDPSVTQHAFDLADPPGADIQRPVNLETHRRAYAFDYYCPPGRLEVHTENLKTVPIGGIIREAVLTTWIHPRLASRERLTLRVAAEHALDLTLPVGASLARVRRDGQEVTPTQAARRLSIPLNSLNRGQTLSTVTLDYRLPRETAADGSLIRPAKPTFSIPCLAFCWEVRVPQPWAVIEKGSGLVASDPVAWLPWPRGASGGWRSAWTPWRSSSTLAREIAMLRALDERVARTRPEEVSLGEWFTRWDAGPWPVVIDRLALTSAGWGPKSRTVPAHLDGSSTGAAQTVLNPMGLKVVPVGQALLVTTRTEIPDRPGGPLGDTRTRVAWELSAREASAWGSDASDRFQSVTRWRGEETPKASAPGEDPDRAPLPEGWRTWRFAASDWTDADAVVRLVDERALGAWTLAAGLFVLAVGIAARLRPVKGRLWAVATLLALSLLAASSASRTVSAIGSGTVGGTLAVVCFWLGRSLPRLSRGPRIDPNAPTVLRSRQSGSTASRLITGLTLACFLVPPVSAELDMNAPVLALFLEEGVPDRASQPTRALLRLTDYERLQAWSNAGKVKEGGAVHALSSIHHVTWRNEREVVVESELELLGEGDPNAFWSFPVDHARDVTATLDAVKVPVRVLPGGQGATVTVAGAGRHRLRIRRMATPRRGDAGATLELPINPVASARIVVASEPGAGLVEVLSAHGKFEPIEKRIEGLLGPADHLEVRWSPRSGAVRNAPSGTVESTFLWDSTPAGDRVRARLTYRNPARTSVIRLGLEPGVVLRSSAIPGLVDAVREGTPERPEWVAHIDPPLPELATIHLEFWRGSDSIHGSVRTLPRIEPLGVERYSGTLGFRRPADWSGRLEPLAGVEAISEEAFVKAWGPLPPEPLTLSGVSRLVRSSVVALATGPLSARLAVQPSVRLKIGSGRVEVDLEADLTEQAGRTDHVEIELPTQLRLVSVAADGLTDWSRSPADRLRIRFDGLQADKPKRIKIRGWVPVPADSLAIGSPSQHLEVPWPRWVGVDTRPGLLTISALTRFQLDPSAGVTLIPPAPGSPMEQSYRVDRPENLGRLRWEVEPPRVGVLVRSQLTIHPDSSEWVAVLRYDVSAGAIDAIRLKIPDGWAAQARVTSVGGGHRLTASSRDGSTFWLIRPEHPIWGSQSLVVRSVLSTSKLKQLEFPDLMPLGRGSVDTYLALANATGRELATEGTARMQPVDYASKFSGEEFAVPSGVPTSAFHVQQEGWSLKVQGLEEARPLRAGDDPARMTLADLFCQLSADGSALGLARFEVESHSGPFLPVELPAGSEPLRSTVNDRPAQLLRAARGQWLIPLREESESHVNLIWRTGPPAARMMARRPVPLPGFVAGRVPTLVTVLAPEGMEVGGTTTSFSTVALDRLELERADWLKRRTTETLSRIDRSSLRDRSSLVSALVQFELLLRGAERSVRWDFLGSPSTRDERVRRVLGRVQAARSALAAEVKASGLDEFSRASQGNLGLSPDGPGRAVVEVPEPATAVALRHLGQPHYFLGESSGAGQIGKLVWAPARPRGFVEREDVWSLILMALATIMVVLALIRGTRRPAWPGLVPPVLSLVIVAVVGGPWELVIGLGMLGLGWMSRS